MYEIEFPFRASQRVRFRSGELIEEWAARYPQLFDARDLEITRKQPNYHFFEWLAAVLIYEATGFLSLIEKYETPSHVRKAQIFSTTVPHDVYDYVMKNRAGVPDLFVYSPDQSQWYFCEVKGAADKLREHQSERIAELSRISGGKVCLLKLKEIPF